MNQREQSDRLSKQRDGRPPSGRRKEQKTPMKPSAVPSTKHATSLTSIPLLQKPIPHLILLPPFPLRQLLQNPPIHRREHSIVPLRPQLRDIRSRQAQLFVHGDELGGLQLGRSAVEGALHRSRGAAFDGREAVDESGDFFCGFLGFARGRWWWLSGLRTGLRTRLRSGLLLLFAWGWSFLGRCWFGGGFAG
jgi:hypothetical protein